MAAGRYIGRVGALAVALGVGTAVGSGYGLAWADTTGTSDSDSTSSSSQSSSTSGSTDTGSKTTTGESTTTGTTTGTTTSTGGSTTSDSQPTTSSTTGTTRTSTSGTQITTGSTTSVTTGSGSSTDPKSTLSAQGVVEGSTTESRTTSQPTSTSPSTKVEKPTETTAVTQPTSTSPSTKVEKPTEPTAVTQPTPSPTPNPEPTPQAQQQTVPDNKSSSTTQSSSNPQPTTATATTSRVPTTTLSANTQSTATSVTAPTALTEPLLSRSLVTALAASAPTPVSLLSPTAVPPPVSPPSPVARAVTSLLSVFGIDLLAGTTPVAPAQSPLLWGLLGWVRRQLAGAVPSTPQISTMTTSLFTAQPVGALDLDPAATAPAATVDAVEPIALDAAAPAALDVATPATFGVEESAALDVATPATFALDDSGPVDATADPATDPTALDTATPMMMAAAVEPVALAATAPTTFAAPVTLAAAALAAPAPGFPAPGAQLSPSTNFISWLTGNFPDNYTLSRFGINGTDVGIIWDNGMVDDPSTPYNEHQLLIAFGDTFGDPNAPGQQWRSNVLLRTSDLVLSDGLSIPNGTVINAADLSTYFGGAPLAYVNFAKQIIDDPNLGPAVTIIPTAGISVPTPGTMFGVTQYINFMAVQQWGNPGYWTTSYSAIAYSQDNGQNWTVAPSTVRLNQWWTGNQNFQQVSYVRPDDGYVYMYGTPNGRQGNAYLARVPEQSMLDLTKYQYWNGSAAAVPGQPGPAGQWVTGNPAAATAIFPIQTITSVGACGALSQSRGAGSTTSEMSVQYNAYLKKYIAMYTDQNNSVVMRTSDLPQGAWSYAKVLMNQQPGGIYAPMMNPWSPSTKGTGSDLYWNLSLFSTYDVMNMRTDLSKVN